MDIATLAAAVAMIRKTLPDEIESSVENSEAFLDIQQRQAGDETAMIQLATETDMLIRDLFARFEAIQNSVSSQAAQVTQNTKELAFLNAGPAPIQDALLILATAYNAEIRSLQSEVATLRAQVNALST